MSRFQGFRSICGIREAEQKTQKGDKGSAPVQNQVSPSVSMQAYVFEEALGIQLKSDATPPAILVLRGAGRQDTKSQSFSKGNKIKKFFSVS